MQRRRGYKWGCRSPVFSYCAMFFRLFFFCLCHYFVGLSSVSELWLFFLLVFSLFLYNCSLRGFTLKIVKVRLGMNSNSGFRRQCLHIETVNWNKDTNMLTFNTELDFFLWFYQINIWILFFWILSSYFNSFCCSTKACPGCEKSINP